VATFADRVLRGQHNGSIRPYSRISRPEPLLFLPSSFSIVLSGPRSWPTASQKIWQCRESNPDLWICNQELGPLYHRGGHLTPNKIINKKSTVEAILRNGAETWSYIHNLLATEVDYLRRSARISQTDGIRNETIITKTGNDGRHNYRKQAELLDRLQNVTHRSKRGEAHQSTYGRTRLAKQNRPVCRENVRFSTTRLVPLLGKQIKHFLWFHYCYTSDH
jgi:hypothetical protein